MVKKIYSVYDVKAKYHLNPIVMKEDAEALRAFADLANDKQTMIGLHPEDFELFYLGTFDDNSAEICVEKIPVFLGRAILYNLKKGGEDGDKS